jgi:transcriptional regulator with XRE-family HTH domain
METLGQKLKETRKSVSLTLRQVEDATGISNAYLSQLENDKIKKPSANTLYKLAGLYCIDIDDLLIAAGIIETKKEVKENSISRKIASLTNDLSKEEEDEIINYIQFLKFRKNP